MAEKSPLRSDFPNLSKHSGDQPQPRHPRIESAANSREAYGNAQDPGWGAVGGWGEVVFMATPHWGQRSVSWPKGTSVPLK